MILLLQINRLWWPGTESNCRHGDFQSLFPPANKTSNYNGFRDFYLPIEADSKEGFYLKLAAVGVTS